MCCQFADHNGYNSWFFEPEHIEILVKLWKPFILFVVQRKNRLLHIIQDRNKPIVQVALMPASAEVIKIESLIVTNKQNRETQKINT